MKYLPYRCMAKIERMSTCNVLRHSMLPVVVLSQVRLNFPSLSGKGWVALLFSRAGTKLGDPGDPPEFEEENGGSFRVKRD